MSGEKRPMPVAKIVQLVCVVLVTLLIVRRELGFATPKSTKAVGNTILPTARWEGVSSRGRWLGRARAPITIVEFADFECPACRAFEAQTLKAARTAYGDTVAVLFRHWPLSYHKHAYPAARASECAAEQSRFEAYHGLLYEKQDSLGLKSYTAFAREAGVPNIEAFDACNSTTSLVPAIEADKLEAVELRSKGTPTIVVDGLMLETVPDSAHLDDLIRAAIKKKFRR